MRARPYFLLALLALVWGVHWSITRIGLDYLPPFTYGALRAGIGLVTVIAISARRGIKLPPARTCRWCCRWGWGRSRWGSC